jgi:hypothetical protein
MRRHPWPNAVAGAVTVGLAYYAAGFYRCTLGGGPNGVPNPSPSHNWQHASVRTGTLMSAFGAKQTLG